VATAVVEERQLLKSLRWWDGFVVALANPGFLIGSLGFSIGALGGWGAMLLWGVSMFLGTLQNWIYSETAAMFPDKSGGIALYANQGWKRYFTLVGPVATFGYWFAWSTVLSIFGIVVGSLIQTQWFSKSTWTLWDGSVHLTLAHFIGIGAIILVWAANMRGIRPTLWMGYLTGGLLMVPLFVFIVLPYFTGSWSSGNMHFTITGPWGGWQLALVWLYIMGWSAYGVETCATFAPEYKDTVRDTNLALKTSALFSLVVYILLPLGVTGTVGTQAAVADPVAFYVPAFEKITGSGSVSGIMVVLLCGSLLLSMNTATADGSRALYGIAKDGMTIKQLYHLSRHHVPARAMTLDMLMNIVLILFVGSTLSILVAGNLGYIASHVFALTGFLLLRKDRPNWPRPIKLSTIWLPIAALLACANLVFIIVGNMYPGVTGYGSLKTTLIGVGVLAISIVAYVIRKLQDKQPLHWRDRTPDVPPSEAAVAVPGGVGS
jgi:amino acid transporter